MLVCHLENKQAATCIFLPVLAILALSHIAAHADTQADTPADAAVDTSQSIHVSSIRNPELKSYRVIIRGSRCL